MPKVVDREVESVSSGPFEVAKALVDAGSRDQDQLEAAVNDALQRAFDDPFFGFSLLIALVGQTLSAARIIAASNEASALVRAFQDQTGLRV